MNKLREILLELIKSAKISGVFQKFYLRVSEDKEQEVYFLKISSVSSKPDLSENFVDYVAIMDGIEEDVQELISRLLKPNATIITREDYIDPAIFVEKMPLLISLDRSKSEVEIMAHILSRITKLLFLKKDTVIKIIKTVIKEDNIELIEAYKMVSRR